MKDFTPSAKSSLTRISAVSLLVLTWEYERVTSELEKTMLRAYADVVAVAKERSIDLRSAAFVLGVRRVVRAALREGINLT